MILIKNLIPIKKIIPSKKKTQKKIKGMIYIIVQIII